MHSKNTNNAPGLRLEALDPIEMGPEVTMGRPLKENGYLAKQAIEQAAERINQATAMIENVVRDWYGRPEAEVEINAALVQMHQALRWLERIGASTQPREI